MQPTVSDVSKRSVGYYGGVRVNSRIPTSAVRPFSPYFVVSKPRIHSIIVAKMPYSVTSMVAGPGPSGDRKGVGGSYTTVETGVYSYNGRKV